MGLHLVRFECKSMTENVGFFTVITICAKNLELRLNQLQDIIILVKECKYMKKTGISNNFY